MSDFLATPVEKNNHRISLALLVAISLGCMVPFLNKAFHVDDPLYLWTARQILAHPLDFYGFTVNWYSVDMPMSEVMMNPPLSSYYLALAADLFGWAESTLHAAFLIPMLAAVIGAYALAKELCAMPLIAALAGVLTPVFLVSSTTLMCDIPMLALWIWATVLWMRGIRHGSDRALLYGAFLIALCGLTKYYGISLIPLLFVYALAYKRRLGKWALFLLIPLAVFAAYHGVTQMRYGKSLLLNAPTYALFANTSESGQRLMKGLTGLFFSGGCFLSVLFYAFLLWSKRTIVRSALATAPLIILFFYFFLQTPEGIRFNDASDTSWLIIIQSYLFALAGVGVLSLAVADLWHKRDPESLLLFLWIFGTFVFASYVNWSVNGRSVLPMVPAVGILIARRIERNTALSGKVKAVDILLPIIFSLVAGVSVSWADYKWADTARTEAGEITRSYAGSSAGLWFQGHWGFQYYMEQTKAWNALDVTKTHMSRGDIMVYPSNNTNTSPVSSHAFRLRGVYQREQGGWLATMNRSMGASFYSDVFGPFPYLICPVPDEKYSAYAAARPVVYNEGGKSSE